MKPIELTEEHKSKLLKMCVELFPNNKIDYIQNDTIKFLTNYYEKKHTNNPKIIFGGWDEILHIHWFEFCMTHLAKKLIPKVTNYNLDSAYDSLYNVIYQFWENKHNHIIDYLYEEFKKLK